MSDGATLGVVGPNGAGKTSLFGMVSGDLPVDSGDIRFDGQSILGMDTARRCQLGIGRTFQVPHPFVGMTVFENVLVQRPAGRWPAPGGGDRPRARRDRARSV